jgi:NAD-dependent deacetylase
MAVGVSDLALAEAREIVRAAQNLLVITGAGMSAECGIPTFRDPGGDEDWDTLAQTVATAEGFEANPQRVWSWYADRRRTALHAPLHPGYRALVQWEQHASVHIVTQNVDGLHKRAGSSSVVEMHGSLHRFICADRRHEVVGVADAETVPRCPSCGSFVRPDVVWFGEMLSHEVVSGSEAAIAKAEAVLLIGTSLLVTTPTGLLWHADGHGIPIVEVNPEPALRSNGYAWPGSGILHAAVTLAGTAGSVLPVLLEMPRA